jgi:hypothetical protein
MTTTPSKTPYAKTVTSAPTAAPVYRAQAAAAGNTQISEVARLQLELRQTKQELAELKRSYGDFMHEYRTHTHVIDAHQYPLSTVMRDQRHFGDLKVLLVPGTAAARTKGVLRTQ